MGAWVAAAVGTLCPARWSIWAVLGLAPVVLALRRRTGRLATVGAVAMGVVIVAPSVAWHVHRLQAGEVPKLAELHATGEAMVKLVRDPVPATSGSGLLVVDATALGVDAGGWREVNAPVLLLARGDRWRELLPGQRVRVVARFAPARPDDDVSAVLDVLGEPVAVGRPPWWQRAAGRARASLRVACSGLPGDERGLLPSLVDGDTSAVPMSLRDDMRVTGLSHLEAVSGENLGIVLGVCLVAMRGIGFRRRSRVAGATAAIAGFVVLARPSPSVQRAAAMSAVMLLAMLTGRRAAARASLAVAVIMLAVLDPFLARSVGFVLSVVATAGIVILAPAWTRRLEARLPRPLAVAVAVSAAAQLACTPVLIVTFGQLTPYAVPANVVAAPAVVPATILGVVAAVVAPMSISLAGPLVWVGGLAAGAVAWVAHTFAALPGAGATVNRPVGTGAALLAAAGFLRAARGAIAVVPREIL